MALNVFLSQEREKYSQAVTKYQKELQEMQSQLVEEGQLKVRLQMELDSKDSEIEQLQGKLASMSSETASLSSADNDTDDLCAGNFECLIPVNQWSTNVCCLKFVNRNAYHVQVHIVLSNYVIFISESRLEGWLSVPNKQNIRRHGWKKQYVVVSSKKIIFYNSESDKQNTDPILILDLK